MVERSGRCAHSRGSRLYLSDRIGVFAAPKLIEKATVARKYRESNQSIRQIAEELGLSKQTVMARLDAAGVKGRVRRGHSPENYLNHNPPYGFRVINNRLVPSQKEMRTVRLVVELRDRRGIGWMQIAEVLNQKRIKNR